MSISGLSSPCCACLLLASCRTDSLVHHGVGVEGVMRSCCEHTLGVLRQNKESLLTIIEVTREAHISPVSECNLVH